MKQVLLTTDGACSGNPGPGGWAALLRFGKHEKLLTGAENETTNNRMELTAVIEGLRAIKEKCHVTICTDSQYILNAFEQGWLENWKENDWRTTNKKSPVKNQELWEELDALISHHKITWKWVKGHSGHEENERVDKAARNAIKELL